MCIPPWGGVGLKKVVSQRPTFGHLKTSIFDKKVSIIWARKKGALGARIQPAEKLPGVGARDLTRPDAQARRVRHAVMESKLQQDFFAQNWTLTPSLAGCRNSR